MRVLGICASHRKSGSSYRLLNEAMVGVAEEDPSIDTKIIELALLKIGACIPLVPMSILLFVRNSLLSVM
jgi:multimeric flavodoxin WrbA